MGRRWAGSPTVRRLLPHLPAALLIIAYAVHFSRLSVAVHQGYGTGAFDVGIFDQGLWLLSRFKAPFVTLNGKNLFAEHASFILIPLVPLYWVYAHAAALLVLQSVVLAGAGIPVYLLALGRLGSPWMATTLLASFLLHPALQWGNVDQFHPESFLVLFASLALYAAITWKPRLLVVSVCLALLVKEDVVLFVVPLALWVALRRDRDLGRRLAWASVTYAFVVTMGVMRRLGGGPALYAGRTLPFGGVSEFLSAVIHRPGRLIGHLLGDGRPFYAWQLAFPGAFMFLRAPEVAAIGLPVVGFNLFSAFAYQHQIIYHYSLVLVPVVTMAGVYGLCAMRSQRARRIGVAAVGVCSLWACLLWGLFPIGDQAVAYRRPTDPQVHQIQALEAVLPPDAVVSAHYTFAPHIAHRTRIYMWPNPFRASYWGTFDREGTRLPEAAGVKYLFLPTNLSAEDQKTMNGIRSEFMLVRQEGDFALYRRVAPAGGRQPAAR